MKVSIERAIVTLLNELILVNSTIADVAIDDINRAGKTS